MTGRCWFWLHEEQCCERAGCRCPRHIGGLCGRCFAVANAVDRSIALLLHSLR